MKNIESNNDTDFDLVHLLKVIWIKKVFVLLTVTSFSLISIIYSLQLPNIYESRAILAPSNESNNSSITSSFSIMGLTQSGAQITDASEAVARIRSRDFFEEHFKPNIEERNLAAVKKWKKNNTIEYNNKLYSSSTNTWINKPSHYILYKLYLDKVNIIENKKTGFITLSVKHQAPYISKMWADLIIKKINDSMRENDIRLASNSINFLNEQSKTVLQNELKEAISQLLEAQMQSLMLASAETDYVLKVIESPSVPEFKSYPRRSLIVLFATFIGLLFGSLFVLIKSLLLTKQS